MVTKNRLNFSKTATQRRVVKFDLDRPVVKKRRLQAAFFYRPRLPI